MKFFRSVLAAVALMLLVDGSNNPIAAQTRWSFCYHYGDQYYGNTGWRITHCVNLYTKEELYVWERI
jgi:hypothetical protein